MKALVITCIVIVTALLVWWLIPKNTELPVVENIAVVTTYIKEHISDLSPVKAELGGTFYVTEVEASSGAGIVAYEDGHQAYVADFKYVFPKDSPVLIEEFVVRD